LKTRTPGNEATVDKEFWEWCRAIRETSLELIEESRRLCSRTDRVDLFATSHTPTQPFEAAPLADDE
jgi:hypothetical protein